MEATDQPKEHEGPNLSRSDACQRHSGSCYRRNEKFRSGRTLGPFELHLTKHRGGPSGPETQSALSGRRQLLWSDLPV